MPAATEDVSDDMSGFLNVRYKGGKKFRWKKKYAVLKQDAIYLSDEKDSIPEDTSELHLPGVFNSCGAYSDKKARKKHGFVLEPVDAEQHEQWYFTCDESDQQQQWMHAINDVISGKKVQKAVSCPEFDDIIVQSTTLQHLAKDRPKFHGRRLPAKRPRSENALNGIPENADAKSETPDSSQANSPARDLAANGASTSAPASPANKSIKDSSPAVKRRDRKKSTFLRGIGARVSRIFGTQPPRSPTSPGRLDAESVPPRVPTIVTDEKPITKVDEEEVVPDVVTKDDIIKMLDFVSETTELVVYRAVGIRGTISSVDETQSKQELRNASKSLRKAVTFLKGTMDSLSQVEDTLKGAPEINRDAPSATDEGTPAKVTIAAAAPIAVDEADTDDPDEDQSVPAEADQRSVDDKEQQTTEEANKGFTDSLDTVEEFEERKPSVSLMDEIQKTLNGEHSISASKDSASKSDEPSPMETGEQIQDEPKEEVKVKEEPKDPDEEEEAVVEPSVKPVDEERNEEVKVKDEVRSPETTSEKEGEGKDEQENSNKTDADAAT